MNHIEIIGIPGSGKSTVVSQLHSREESIDLISNIYKRSILETIVPGRISPVRHLIPTRSLPYLARVSGLTDRAVNFHSIKHNKHISLSSNYLNMYSDDEQRIDRVSGWITTLAEQYGTIDQFAPEGTSGIIDEGIVHLPLPIFCPPEPTQSVSEDHIREYASTLPVPDELIYLRVSTEICESRLYQRDRGYPQDYHRFGRKEMATKLELMAKCIDLVADVLDSRGASVIQIDNSTSVEHSLSTFRIESNII